MSFTKISVLGISLLWMGLAKSQPGETRADTLKAVDLGDLIYWLFGKMPPMPPEPGQAKTAWAVLPSLGYNPSFGVVLGGKLSAARQLGDPSTTMYSVANVEAFYGTRNILTMQARYNIFTDGNLWNWQGHLQLSDFSLLDYGPGTQLHEGYPGGPPTLPVKSRDSAFNMSYLYKRIHQRIYHKVGKHWYAGIGLHFDMRSNIRENGNINGYTNPHLRQSETAGFLPNRHAANGWLVNVQFNTRDHPLRSYRGWYADAGFRVNSSWLGSSQPATQFIIDVRKYVSLSPPTPSHVLAFWHYGSYLLSGRLPYFEMPATGTDTYNRAGRGYTIGRFRGESLAGFEGEYRFPILRNQFISGVAFGSIQSAGSRIHPGLFTHWQPAGGGGLRILLNRNLRSTLCIDYARGVYGARGLFFGLNEVF